MVVEPLSPASKGWPEIRLRSMPPDNRRKEIHQILELRTVLRTTNILSRHITALPQLDWKEGTTSLI